MPLARTTDPKTSHEAAASVSNLTATQTAILDLFKRFSGLTDEELNHLYRRASSLGVAPYASDSGIRSRRSELVAQGLVEDSGTRKKTRAGRATIVWRAV